MAAPIPRYEVGDTRQFTITYSAAPGTTPYFAVRQGSGEGTLILSATATISSVTQFYNFYTMPACEQVYSYEWCSSYSTGPVVNRGVFKVIRTRSG